MSPDKIAYVFPGQGSQSVGMGADIYSRSDAARSIYDRANAVLGFSLSGLCFNGPDEELVKTINVQPAILATGIAMLEAAREIQGDKLPAPACMAGHSLGHYTALAASGAISLEDALVLVRERGRLMYEAGQKDPGGMLAVIGVDENAVTDICLACGAQVSNLNSPGQVIVSGSHAELELFKKAAAEKGIRRILPLKVSGAFHSRHMQPAAGRLIAAVEKCKFRDPSVPIYSNVSASVLQSTEAIKQDLIEQLTACVRWQESTENMAKDGANGFLEIGNAQVVSGLIKRIDEKAVLQHVNDYLATAGT
jgi:[acyl-carrier-protein] S-malonyltransferase